MCVCVCVNNYVVAIDLCVCVWGGGCGGWGCELTRVYIVWHLLCSNLGLLPHDGHIQ